MFGAKGNEPLDAQVVRQKFETLAGSIARETGNRMQAEVLVEGFLRIAIEKMAHAIKQISIQRGHDVTEYVLCCFGGAAGQHACLVADALGVTRIFMHPFAGVLSAYGMGLADVRALRHQTVEADLDDDLLQDLAGMLDSMEAEARDELEIQGIASPQVHALRKVHLKYAGTDTALVVDFAERRSLLAAFSEAHRQTIRISDAR